jgi:adenylate kinase
MTNEGKTVNGMTVEQQLAIRKEAALQIDPETAEIMCTHANIADPYGIYPECPEECIGNVFRRPSGSDVHARLCR